MTDLTLSVTRILKASPKAVYDAWLDPDTIARFMAGGAGQTVTEARTDPRVGGAFRIVMTSDKAIPHQGIYLDLVPHRLIRFTWESLYSPADSEVTIRLAPVAEGTEVTLTQVRFLSESARDGHRQGWDLILQRLAGVMAEAAA
ncbi:SRPBCC family protein [Tabrizicola aquatica]|uniref:SRPBCC family protein n=1 Tax=Tabrizicola aquatica TaxID=909926 RepID=UPI000CD2F5E2|nr:SRPBCC domain-containing protein [Tabrizicola aquatica]